MPSLSDCQLLDSDKALVKSISMFDEVPAHILNPQDWSVVSKHIISSPQFITKLEGRALLSAVKHTLRSAASFGCRHLFLVDNMSLCLAVTKGRSSSPDLVHVCRKIACLPLATNIRVCTRWIPSELNIADGPSRGLNYPSGCNNASHTSNPTQNDLKPKRGPFLERSPFQFGGTRCQK